MGPQHHRLGAGQVSCMAQAMILHDKAPGQVVRQRGLHTQPAAPARPGAVIMRVKKPYHRVSAGPMYSKACSGSRVPIRACPHASVEYMVNRGKCLYGLQIMAIIMIN